VSGAGGQIKKEETYRPRSVSIWSSKIQRLYERLENAFKGADTLQESMGIMDNINGILIAVEKYRRGLPPVLIRTFTYDSFNRLEEFAREYRGYIIKVIDYAYGELPRRLNRFSRK
jgi:hypothetical protein